MVIDDWDNVLTVLLCVVVIVANTIWLARNRHSAFGYLRILAMVVAVYTAVPEIIFMVTRHAIMEWFSTSLMFLVGLLALQAIVRLIVRRRRSDLDGGCDE